MFLYDIFFIADNCSDHTASTIQSIIEENHLTHFHVLERFNEDPKLRGKPHALQWGIQQLESKNKFYQTYDMLMVLDADNFVDPLLLRHFNSQYLSYPESSKPCMIQCYLDSKNANNIIERGYKVEYRISNRFFQYAKTRLHLNCCHW